MNRFKNSLTDLPQLRSEKVQNVCIDLMNCDDIITMTWIMHNRSIFGVTDPLHTTVSLKSYYEDVGKCLLNKK